MSHADFCRQLCDWLVENAGLSDGDIERARRLITIPSVGDLFLCLLKLGLISEVDLARGWSVIMEIPLVTAEKQLSEGSILKSFSERFLRHNHIVPLQDDADAIHLLMAIPADEGAIAAVRYACGVKPALSVASVSLITEMLDHHFGDGRTEMNSLIETLDSNIEAGSDDIEHLKDQASEAPVIRLVNLIIQRGVDARASDIHLEPFEKTLKVRFRIDGVLHQSDAPPVSSAAAVISRVKIMAKLDIAERRLPQDGRIILRIQGRSMDLRVSTLPTVFGESVVLRLLDRENVQLNFAHLGFDDHFLSRFTQLLNSPHGILLVTGPTGSGKTTTLYTALSQLNQTERKIITVEDPVEYQMEGVNQIQVKPAIGLDFAGALRSIMRQDPDVIMIGEMRDLATCRIAIQSSLTGHLVLSTLHTNSAAESITRLIEMGVENYLLASTLRGVLAQRLVRRLDPATRIPYLAPAALVEKLGLDAYTAEHSVTLWRADETARGGGYYGRVAISELLVVDDEIRSLLLANAAASTIEEYASREQNFLSLYQEGLRQAVNGTTSLEEVLRVMGKAE